MTGRTMLSKTLLSAALVGFAFLSAAPTMAHDYKAGAMVIDHPWARPTLPNRPTAGYFGLDNTAGEADRLISASSPAFGRVELHRTTEKDGVMSMEAQDAVDIPAGGTLSFEPGGYHIMLFDAVEPLAEGDRVPMELVFEKAGSVTVELAVEKRGAAHGEADHSNHGGHSGNHGQDKATTN
ncbi:MAG: copper chaperone PCu(A)C [Pseudomonadota bacterium]